MFLEECKYVVKEKNMLEYITEDMKIFSGDSNENIINEEIFDEKNSD